MPNVFKLDNGGQRLLLDCGTTEFDLNCRPIFLKLVVYRLSDGVRIVYVVPSNPKCISQCLLTTASTCEMRKLALLVATISVMGKLNQTYNTPLALRPQLLVY